MECRRTVAAGHPQDHRRIHRQLYGERRVTIVLHFGVHLRQLRPEFLAQVLLACRFGRAV